ncbi:mechanosensitive ion channel family protein [Vicingaceae bacterium]|jgi:small-conductance mechanosensitive channel|nr:mechanosensitive ion channel family protein [Vicingaceae bacterium]
MFDLSQINLLELKLIESIVVLIIIMLLKLVVNYFISKTVVKSLLNKTRGKLIRKILNFALTTLFIITVLIIWGVDQSELIVFMTSVLTVIGVALVAQWSLLSNLTAGVILFFNHSIKLDDTITIMDKDYEQTGRIVDIGYFFITLKTVDGDQITLPSNVFLQKTIKKKVG